MLIVYFDGLRFMNFLVLTYFSFDKRSLHYSFAYFDVSIE